VTTANRIEDSIVDQVAGSDAADDSMAASTPAGVNVWDEFRIPMATCSRAKGMRERSSDPETSQYFIL